MHINEALVALEEISESFLRWLYKDILLTERFPKFGCEGNSQRV